MLTLDRPNRAHAYDEAHLRALRAGFQALSESVSVVVVQSTGERAFCGGADLKSMKEATPLDALDLLSQRVFAEIADSHIVSIAAVQGAAVAGGCELALACDLRVVGPAARFELPETALGLIPAAGGCTRLARLVGQSVARQVILAGTSISADQAIAWGLATGEVQADPRAAALELGRSVAQRDPVALRLAKHVLAQDGRAESLQAERIAEALLYGRKNRR
jgi:enoyl-CoA hydratase